MERTRTKKTTTRKTGKVSRGALFLSLILCLLVGSAGAAFGARKPKKSDTAASPAVFAGTVFNGAGFALRGAEITVTGAANPKDRWKAISDARGEFFLRLPAGPAKYNVSVRAKGMKPQEKQVSFEADERLDQNFLLEPAAGSAK